MEKDEKSYFIRSVDRSGRDYGNNRAKNSQLGLKFKLYAHLPESNPHSNKCDFQLSRIVLSTFMMWFEHV